MKLKDKLLYRIPHGSPDWHAFRTYGLTEQMAAKYNMPAFNAGIGASEMGNVLGISKWRPVRAELWMWKVGLEEPIPFDNESMMMGRLTEDTIGNILWCNYDGSTETLPANVTRWQKAPAGERSGLKIRRNHKVNAYVINKKYPWLFSSFDFYAENDTPSLLGNRDPQPDGFPIEVKNIGYHYAKMFDEGVPDQYIAQLHVQMICAGVDYGELAVVVDGKYFRLFPIEKDKNLERIILEVSEEFMHRVWKGKELMAERDNFLTEGNVIDAENREGQMQHLEPDPDSSVSYEEFLKERHEVEDEFIKGNDEDYHNAYQYKLQGEYVNRIKEKQQYFKNLILKRFKDNRVERIDMDELGKITLKTDSRGIQRLTATLKEKIDKEMTNGYINLLPDKA